MERTSGSLSCFELEYLIAGTVIRGTAIALGESRAGRTAESRRRRRAIVYIRSSDERRLERCGGVTVSEIVVHDQWRRSCWIHGIKKDHQAVMTSTIFSLMPQTNGTCYDLGRTNNLVRIDTVHTSSSYME